MALPPNLPPQAYTRDTLVKAIEWLTTQPAAVRERANSADLIVSHFLASRRRTPYLNDSALTDFKMLAEDIRQLDEPSANGASAAPPAQAPAPVDKPEPAPYVAMAADFSPTPRSRRREAPRAPSAQTSLPMDFDPPAATAAAAPPPPVSRSEPETQVGHARGVPEPDQGPRGLTWSVDQRSRTIAREVQDRMNLSSESEALRMLVAMGAERLRSVLP